ncbi:DUF4058 family protein [Romeria aff. gracilis LEGE 07310]|uniref:DUF4058 family protein n=1 Tax=Vasconcelosia minhoensis LEGE 07310 TaxID=915328 RepID=A0A8J7DBK0_9CYAN|nr:DUF4058 family protein [Romeria gracilis]MBE9076508.1 DUF4058 family protein [Romeria aff. gracilis LEGE 07310]
MPSPFPGMDPYLEHPEIWPGVHLLLISALAELLTPILRPKYAVSIEVRMYKTAGEQALLVDIPDAVVQRSDRVGTTLSVAEPASQPISVRLPMPESVRQGYLEIREVATRSVVAAIELLSPVNKRPGQGRQTYLTKRERILSSNTHLVEIDLLRAWKPMPILMDEDQQHYCILVSRSEVRPVADLYTFNLQDAVPLFALPLAEGDSEPTVNLKALLNQIYDRGAYDLKLDYSAAAVPPLSSAASVWAKQHLSTHSAESP